MDELYSQYQRVLMWLCLGAAVAGAHVLFVWKVLPCLWDVVVRMAGGNPRNLRVLVVLLFVCPLCWYGMTKSSFRYDGGIVQGDTPSWASNDTVFVSWKKDPHNPLPLPLESAVYIDYRPVGNTNDWGLLAQSTVGAWQWTGTLANATGYEYSVWAYYIPPAPHTNGVWEYKTTYSRDGERIVPFHARIEVGGKAIAMPDQKRKDEER